MEVVCVSLGVVCRSCVCQECRVQDVCAGVSFYRWGQHGRQAKHAPRPALYSGRGVALKLAGKVRERERAVVCRFSPCLTLICLAYASPSSAYLIISLTTLSFSPLSRDLFLSLSLLQSCLTFLIPASCLIIYLLPPLLSYTMTCLFPPLTYLTTLLLSPSSPAS